MSEIYNLTGRIHSIQSLAASDGPGVRFAVFLQGCPLRCGCCHNPDTWNPDGGKVISAGEIVEKATRYRTYFGSAGGVTVSGGEPLLQAEFVKTVFSLCKEQGINTCLDTSGCIWNEDVEKLLGVTDRVLLDVKYTDEEKYRKYVGCKMEKPLEFLRRLNEKRIPTTLRQVIIPSLNDDEENIRALKEIANSHPCVDKIELLPFRKMCQIKYDNLGMEFPFGNLPEPTPENLKRLESILAESV
ncbi:MAG: pyruvate formate lyase-activating protein [Ruminococcaceae bacterium]|nr:pyruvate formate lyase-activating protein [Oscillospiraceae bacterium]